MKHSSTLVAFATLAALVACEPKERALGGPSGESTVSSSAAGDAPRAAGLPGTWAGWIEHWELPSGTDSITLAISERGGTLTFGKARSFDEPPEVAPDGGGPTGALLEGYRYTVVEKKRTVDRYAFGIDSNEPWRAWCEAQSPVQQPREFRFVRNPEWDAWRMRPSKKPPRKVPRLLDAGLAPPSYACVFGQEWSTSSSGCQVAFPDGGEGPEDCARLALCHRTCRCDEARCRAPQKRRAEFDLALIDGRLEGSAHGVGGGRVHFRRR